MSQPYTAAELANERWRAYPDSDYEVSDLGRVRSRAWGRLRPVRPFANTQGYLMVNWRRPGGRRLTALVHRMVLILFRGPCPGSSRKIHGCHYDGDKRNNRLSNLRWDTAAGNAADNRRLGRGPQKLTAREVLQINQQLKAGRNQRLIARDFGVSQVLVCHIHTGRVWGHVTGKAGRTAE